MPLNRYQKVNHPLLNHVIGSSGGLDVGTYHKPSGDGSNEMSVVSSNLGFNFFRADYSVCSSRGEFLPA
jgi:hypothetical protein